MRYAANIIEPSMEDILMTALQLAAEELAEVYPQAGGDSIEKWKGYLIQQSLKKQGQFTEEQRFAYARDVLCREKYRD